MKPVKANLGRVPIDRCGKCGSPRLELVEDGLECFMCGWVFYMTDEQIAAFRAGGLDKVKTVCKDGGRR